MEYIFDYITMLRFRTKSEDYSSGGGILGASCQQPLYIPMWMSTC